MRRDSGWRTMGPWGSSAVPGTAAPTAVSPRPPSATLSPPERTPDLRAAVADGNLPVQVLGSVTLPAPGRLWAVGVAGAVQGCCAMSAAELLVAPQKPRDAQERVITPMRAGIRTCGSGELGRRGESACLCTGGVLGCFASASILHATEPAFALHPSFRTQLL